MAGSRGHTRSIPLLVGVAVVVFVADQLTKAWALERLADGDIGLIFDWRLHLVRNPAAAFSIGGGLGPLIGVLALGVVAALVVMSRDYRGKAPTVFVGMIVGGALGNIADRAFRSADGFLGGEVIDFIDVRFWPVFNVADSAVVVGVILLALYSAFFDSRRAEDGRLDEAVEPGDDANDENHDLESGDDENHDDLEPADDENHNDLEPADDGER